jgi:hypothetical protein
MDFLHGQTAPCPSIKKGPAYTPETGKSTWLLLPVAGTWTVPWTALVIARFAVQENRLRLTPLIHSELRLSP